MPDTTSNNKRIAKNTIALYFRMMFTMIVSLYTSRVILQYLGVVDFGIYNTVAGVVAMLSYLNSALSVGTSRFITYELGTENYEKLAKVFSSVLSVHFIFALIILILGETLGLWFVCNKLVIPIDRMNAALWCYHLSLLSCMMSITQVPYSASIISHEKMSLYAYTSIVDVLAKLLIVYLLTLTTWDRLKFYSLLFFIETVSMMCFYRWYCIRNFEETRYKISIDRQIIKDVLTYSGWNVFATTSVSLCSQGITIITNLFFNPSVVAARAVANQVDQAARGFFNNFKTASNPQIVKSYAAGDIERSKTLVLQTAKYGYFLMLLIGLPVILVAKPLLCLWLGQVPEYSVPFLQLAMLTSLVAVFDISFYAALYAKGQIMENSILSSVCLFLAFIVIYVLFKLGFSPIWSAIILFLSQCVISFFVKPIMLIKIVNYRLCEILSLFWDCLKVTIISVIIPIYIYSIKDVFSCRVLYEFLVLVSVAIFSVCITVWYWGIDISMREKIKKKMRSISIVKKNSYK